MTLPGKMLTESVQRLATSIAASKAVSDELKAASILTPAQPVPIREVSDDGGDSAQPNAA